MQIITFKNLDNALDYITSGGITINKFYEYVRELEEKQVIKINNEYIFIDELNLLN